MHPKTQGIIWVVDDSETDAGRVTTTLKDDYQVVVFRDGAAALEQLASSPTLPDLMLLDWVMPGLSGVEICEYVRSAKPPLCQVPIILLTAQYGPEEIVQAFKSGANDYIIKPFVDEELKARVKTLTGARRHLKRAQDLVTALQRSEERVLLATSAAGVGIWEWDIKTGFVTSTDIHRKIFGLEKTGPVTFREFHETILPSDREVVQLNLSQAIEGKSDYESEFQIQRADGSTAWIYGKGRAVYDEEGSPLRMVGIHLDVSAQKKNEADLKRAKEDAERANQLKSAFLANMSHEIRTPLGAMLGFAHLMQDPTISAMELSNHLEVLTRNGEQLSIIIDDILDLSKVESGLLTYEKREFDPAEICADVLSLFQAKAKEKGLTLQYIKDPSTPPKVTSDPTRVRQVLLNLVGNALKFTQSGSIKIKSFGIASAEGNALLAMDVEDTGMGVPPEHAERIFDMFIQADDSTTRKFGGTGIGLALSRRLARELGGDLVLLKSAHAEGSTFRASIKDMPSATASASPQVVAHTFGDKTLKSIDGVRVLVVDDAPDNQQLLTRYLTKRGAVVEVASNGLEGYTEALRSAYDIVLMDLQMPLMDGYAATKKLRSVGYKKPIIALTAHAMSEISAKCLDAGCSGFLPKPINPKDLVEKIADHVR